MTLASPASETPFLSIILPVRNEAPFIDANIERLLTQDYPADRYEILVVDGESTDDTARRAREWVARDARVRLLDNSSRFVANGLNLALPECRGELICWVDGHMLLERHYLSTGVGLLAEHPEAWSVGGPITHVGSGVFGRAVAAAQSHPIGVGNARHRYREYDGYGEGAINPIYRRSVFDRVGTFDEGLVRNQDDEFNFRITQAGGKILISSRMNSIYYVRESMPLLFRQYAQYAFWRIPMLKKYGRPTHLRQLVPPAFYLLMLALLIAGVVQGSLLLAAGLPIAYLSILALTSASLVRRLGLTVALVLPLAFLGMHAGYAYGYLSGFLAAIFRPNAWSAEGRMAKLTR